MPTSQRRGRPRCHPLLASPSPSRCAAAAFIGCLQLTMWWSNLEHRGGEDTSLHAMRLGCFCTMAMPCQPRQRLTARVDISKVPLQWMCVREGLQRAPGVRFRKRRPRSGHHAAEPTTPTHATLQTHHRRTTSARAACALLQGPASSRTLCPPTTPQPQRGWRQRGRCWWARPTWTSSAWAPPPRTRLSRYI